MGTMPNLTDGADDLLVTQGIVCYRVPVGDANFVDSFLIKKASRIVSDLEMIGE